MALILPENVRSDPKAEDISDANSDFFVRLTNWAAGNEGIRSFR
jgi:hypothetical protein